MKPRTLTITIEVRDAVTPLADLRGARRVVFHNPKHDSVSSMRIEQISVSVAQPSTGAATSARKRKP